MANNALAYEKEADVVKNAVSMGGNMVENLLFAALDTATKRGTPKKKSPTDLSNKTEDGMIKTSAVTKLQNAFRNKRAIHEFAIEYAKKIIEAR